jgi:hypothetical protein
MEIAGSIPFLQFTLSMLKFYVHIPMKVEKTGKRNCLWFNWSCQYNDHEASELDPT